MPKNTAVLLALALGGARPVSAGTEPAVAPPYDVATTLGSLLGVRLGDAVGRVLAPSVSTSAAAR